MNKEVRYEVFKHPEFGEVKVFIVKDKFYFALDDIARILGISEEEATKILQEKEEEN